MINFSELLWRPRSKSQARRPALLSEPVPDVDEDFSVLAQVPEVEAYLTPESRIPVATDPRGRDADRFRLLRMRLRELRAQVKVRTVLVSSPLPQDGKSTISMNLATVLAEQGKRNVLLIEADLHRPSIAKVLKLDPAPGLTDCMVERKSPFTVMQKVKPLGLYLIQAGTPRENPAELFQDDFFGTVMEDLNRHFEWIILDTSPLMVLSDAVQLSTYADTSILVTRIGRTPKDALLQAIQTLGSQHVFGVIVNGGDRGSDPYSSYNSYYRRH